MVPILCFDRAVKHSWSTPDGDLQYLWSMLIFEAPIYDSVINALDREGPNSKMLLDNYRKMR
jgi:hypothetical protein